MVDVRTIHTTRIGTFPDGKTLVACACPIGTDHPPAAVITPAGPGLWWIRYAPLIVAREEAPDDDAE